KPETVIAWHRKGFRLYWRWKSRHLEGPPSVSNEVRNLIRKYRIAFHRYGRDEYRTHGSELELCERGPDPPLLERCIGQILDAAADRYPNQDALAIKHENRGFTIPATHRRIHPGSRSLRESDRMAETIAQGRHAVAVVAMRSLPGITWAGFVSNCCSKLRIGTGGNDDVAIFDRCFLALSFDG